MSPVIGYRISGDDVLEILRKLTQKNFSKDHSKVRIVKLYKKDDPVIKRAAEELFVPCAFNTWDRSNPKRNKAMKTWATGLENSWWGYLRIIDSEGNQVIGGTRQITSRRAKDDVKRAMIEALEDLDIDIPDYLQ